MINIEKIKMQIAKRSRVDNKISTLLFTGIMGIVSVLMIWQSLAAASLPATRQDNAHTYISITDQGFVPKTVTTTINSAIVWINDTNHTIQIVSSTGYQVFLPAIIKGDNATLQNIETSGIKHPVSTKSLSGVGDWGSDPLSPGDLYTHTFSALGNYPYHLLDNLNIAGLIVVESFTGETSTPTPTNTPTTISTATVIGTSTEESTPTLTGTATATAIFTNTPTTTSTATVTSTPTDTSTPTPTGTSAATATFTNTPTPTDTPTPTVTSTPNVNPDLAIHKDDGGVIVAAGDIFTYTITFSNTSESLASGIVITETLPNNTTFNSNASTTGWQQVGTSNEYIYDVGNLNSEESGITMFAVEVDNPVPSNVISINNTTTLRDDGSHGEDPNLENNTSSIRTWISRDRTDVCGTITEDTTWGAFGSPYVVTCNVIINNDVILTVESGTVIKFESGRSLTINGTLLSQGIASNHVTITSIKDDSVGGDTNNDGNATLPAPRDWGAIIVGSTGITSLDYTLVQYGGNYQYSSGIYMTGNGQLVLNHSTVSHNYGNGIYLRNSLDQTAHLEIYNSIIEYNGASGVLTTNNDSSITVSDSIFRNNGSTGISCSGDSCSLTNLVIRNNGSYGISASSNLASLEIRDNLIEGNGNSGISFDSTKPYDVRDNIINNNEGFAISTASTSSVLTPMDLSLLQNNSGSGNSIDGIRILGYIKGILNNTNPDFPYILDASGYPSQSRQVHVTSGNILTIEPGVIIKSDTDSYRSKLNVDGILNANGTTTNPIYFTSLEDDSIGGDTNNNGNATMPSAGDWDGIDISANGIANMDYVHIAYDGIDNDGQLTLTNSIVQNGDGIYCANSIQCHIGTSTIENNSSSGISCSGDSCSLTNLVVRNNGSYGISASSNVTPLEIRDNLIEGNGNSGISFNSTKPYDVRDNIINNNEGFAISTASTSSVLTPMDLSLLQNNSGSGNSIDGIRILGYIKGILNNNNPDFPYILDATGYPGESRQVHVTSGNILTIEPGVIIKSDTNSYDSKLNVAGILNANGTTTNPIYFTSLEDDSIGGDTNNNGNATMPSAGDWDGIDISANGIANMDYVHIAYDGIDNDGQLTLTNSTVRDSNSIGIYNNIGASLFVANSNIYNNSSYGVYNSSSNNIVQVKNSWWGSSSGPAPYGSGNGINYQTCSDGNSGTYICKYYVDADPWLGKQVAQSGNIIEHALPNPPNRNTVPAKPGIPYIESVTAENGFFAFGVGGSNTNLITVKVDWNGSDAGDGTPDIVRFKLGSNTYDETGNSEGGQHTLQLSTLSAGFNDLEIVAINAGGVESTPYTARLARFLAPEWLVKLGFVDGSHLEIVEKPAYTEVKIAVTWPISTPLKAEMNTPNLIPLIGGRTGIRESQVELELALRSDSVASAELKGETGFKSEKTGQEVAGFIQGEGEVSWNGAGVLQLDSASAEIGLTGALKGRESILSVIPPLAAASQTPIIGDLLKKLYLEGKVEPTVAVGVGFKSNADDSDLDWYGLTGESGLKVTISLGVEVWKDKIEASVYGGGEGKMELQFPANPSYLEKASGGFFVGATLEAWMFETQAEKTWAWEYVPGDALAFTNDTLTTPMPEWVAHPIADVNIG